MTLQELMNLSKEKSISTQSIISEERINAQIDNIRKLIAFFREYPDIFIDFIKGPDSKFKLYNYQRIILRAAMRHRYVYMTLPRGSSKSFLSMLILMLRCILYPGSEMFVTTGGKEQAASITISKIEQLCSLIPALDNELNRERGQTRNSTKDVKYIFKNGSTIDVLSATEKTRGQRRTGIPNQTNCPFKIAEKNWKPEMVIRGEGENQPQRIGIEIIYPRGRDTFYSEKIC